MQILHLYTHPIDIDAYTVTVTNWNLTYLLTPVFTFTVPFRSILALLALSLYCAGSAKALCTESCYTNCHQQLIHPQVMESRGRLL